MKSNEIEKLVEKAKGRDPDAFTQLMQHYMKDMYRVALAVLMNDEDAADAISETILTCFEKIGTLKKNYYFKTWLTRILLNKCYDIRKDRKHYVSMDAEKAELVGRIDADDTRVDVSMAGMVSEDDCNSELKEALFALDEKYRVLITMYYLEGYSIAEISGLLKIPKSTVQTRLWRGRKKLGEYLRGK